MNETGIIWTEKTWNPMSGCTPITEGCKFCYAQTLAEAKRGTSAFPNGFDLTMRPHKLREPFALKTPTLIFTNSMSDLFWDQVPNEYRHKIVDVIEQTPQHEYQVLTKRPEALLKFSKERQLPPNFWAGVTVESGRLLHRLDILREVRAEVRYVSAEPLLSAFGDPDLSGIHWMITGGESGTHLWDLAMCERRGLVIYDRQLKKWLPRPDRIDWVREIRDACIAQRVKFFHKQWGGSYPEAAGRMLDGRTWNEMPRLPGQRTEINNEYLRQLERRDTPAKNRDGLLFDSVQ